MDPLTLIAWVIAIFIGFIVIVAIVGILMGALAILGIPVALAAAGTTSVLDIGYEKKYRTIEVLSGTEHVERIKGIGNKILGLTIDPKVASISYLCGEYDATPQYCKDSTRKKILFSYPLPSTGRSSEFDRNLEEKVKRFRERVARENIYADIEITTDRPRSSYSIDN